MTLVGNDRPGIVEAVSELIVQHQGDWVDSRMANLSGKFAGILHADIPDAQYQAFCDAVDAGIDGLEITLETIGSVTAPVGQCYILELVGQNQPGIIHQISSTIADNGATIEELSSEISDASMSGEKLFKASIKLCLPPGQDIEDLGEVLEELANELIVDIELGE
jgi:glycine cleavage system regulatory protein